MGVILASTLIVALAEAGDKTMLLAIVLVSRFRQSVSIIAGILFATLANHALAAWAGAAAAGLLDGKWFRIIVAAGFLAMAAWTLVPDKLDNDDSANRNRRFGAFLTTLTTFFLVEIGDKTQIATVALGARYQSIGLVTVGTTLGMMLANTPAVFLGERLTQAVPLRHVRFIAAALFAALGLWALVDTIG